MVQSKSYIYMLETIFPAPFIRVAQLIAQALLFDLLVHVEFVTLVPLY